MDQNTDLFVQAFWVKCREVIRPEIDTAIGDIRRAGHEANVSTQEFSQVADRLPGHVGPSLTLALKPAGATDDIAHPTIEFHGDIAREAIDIVTSDDNTDTVSVLTGNGDGTFQDKVEYPAGWVARSGDRQSACQGSPQNSTSSVPIMPWGALPAPKCADFLEQ